MAEESDNKLLKRLICQIKEGPDINYCTFSKSVYFMTIALLRAFVKYCSATKQLIMNDKI
jgi:hypothetical protein